VLLPYLLLRRGRRAYHRRFSAVWMAGPAPGGGEVVVGFRDDALRRDVAQLSGALVEAPGEAPYRAAGAAPGPAFRGRKNPVPGWAVVPTGLLTIGAGFAEYHDIGQKLARGAVVRGPWLEILVLKLAGRGGVLALFVVVGLAIGAAGVALWRSAHARR
jgi:hypothetical protein